MNGIVSGGWSFVWAAYGVSALVLTAYCAHVVHGFFKTLASVERGAKGTSP
jgi:heme exporter protein D